LSKIQYDPPKKCVIPISVIFYEIIPSVIAPDKLNPY
jgi:hypothetical protein